MKTLTPKEINQNYYKSMVERGISHEWVINNIYPPKRKIEFINHVKTLIPKRKPTFQQRIINFFHIR